jgi:hypothetical protein
MIHILILVFALPHVQTVSTVEGAPPASTEEARRVRSLYGYNHRFVVHCPSLFKSQQALFGKQVETDQPSLFFSSNFAHAVQLGRKEIRAFIAKQTVTENSMIAMIPNPSRRAA